MGEQLTQEHQHALLSSVSRVAVVDALRAAPEPVAVADLARSVGLHQNTVRWHLDQLADAGLVDRVVESKGRRGRPRVLYAATAQASIAPTSDDGYRLLADILAGYLEATRSDVAAAATEAGRAWAERLITKPATRVDEDEAGRRVVGLLDDLGFDPEAKPDSANGDIALHACPFRDVADTHPEVACSVHLGLMQGALVELGMPAMAARLKPSRARGGCTARIETPPERHQPERPRDERRAHDRD
jgi:predicted ArsR family transcriptional regulator